MDYNHEDQGETFDKATGAPVGHKPPKPITIKTDDGVAELVLVDDGADNIFTKRRRRGGPPMVTHMKRYAVMVDGQKIGVVYQSRATFERKTAGRTYVNSRWYNVRWYFDLDNDPAYRMKWGDRRSTDIETRKRAVEGLLHLRAYRLKSAAEADPSIEFLDV
jgi:hypothetical protein